MIERYCPQCDHLLKPADMNLAEGVALCPACGSLTRLSLLAGANDSSAVASSGDGELQGQWRDMPSGCKVDGFPGDVTLTASARSIGAAVGLLFFTLFWNGVTSLFIIIMLAGFHANFVGPTGSWADGTPIEAGNDMSLPECFFLLLFLTPFMLVGVAMFGAFFVALFGDARVRIRGDFVSAGVGIGPLRWASRCNISDVRDVHLGMTKWQQNDHHKPLIVIVASKDIRFGSSLSKRRMGWLASASRVLLLTPDSEDASQLLASGHARRF